MGPGCRQRWVAGWVAAACCRLVLRFKLTAPPLAHTQPVGQIANPKCKDAPGCGRWPRPSKRNPNYKGVWLAPRIPNPNYQVGLVGGVSIVQKSAITLSLHASNLARALHTPNKRATPNRPTPPQTATNQGEWKPRLIPNPLFFAEPAEASPLARVAPLGAVAFEIWTTDRGYLFDGVLVAGGEGGAGAAAAAAYRRDVWRRRYWEEVRGGGVVVVLLRGRQRGAGPLSQLFTRAASARLQSVLIGQLQPPPTSTDSTPSLRPPTAASRSRRCPRRRAG
jgi:hypothetical protein